MVTGVVVGVVDDGPTRLPLLTVDDSNSDGVVVVAMDRDDDCVTVDDSVTRPFTPDASDAFEVLDDWVGLSDNQHRPTQ